MPKWFFKSSPPKLDELKPEVKQKALAIAQKLVEEKNLDKEKAIQKGIRQAEEWFLNSQG